MAFVIIQIRGLAKHLNSFGCDLVSEELGPEYWISLAGYCGNTAEVKYVNTFPLSAVFNRLTSRHTSRVPTCLKPEANKSTQSCDFGTQIG